MGELIDKGIIEPLLGALSKSGNPETVIELTWLLSHILAAGKKFGVLVLQAPFPFIELLVKVLNNAVQSRVVPLLVPLIRVLSNIVCVTSGPEDKTTELLGFPMFLPCILQCLRDCDNRAVKKVIDSFKMPFYCHFLLLLFFFFLLSSFFLFLISYFLFLISYFLFLISYFLFLISYFLFFIFYFLFLISFILHYFLFIIFNVIQIVNIFALLGMCLVGL